MIGIVKLPIQKSTLQQLQVQPIYAKNSLGEKTHLFQQHKDSQADIKHILKMVHLIPVEQIPPDLGTCLEYAKEAPEYERWKREDHKKQRKLDKEEANLRPRVFETPKNASRITSVSC